ncbi:hypothetical protein QBC40DRAFT_254698 [Triangularia verruculosa]|uniref:Uncharacterized protein n=1 Tax=Triangularia verruculosa TaxID=2587418 RepID=A0AAN6XFT0_9PEZI|nr:hypothetical protein QBC40DRAFT_254698 [Triangularia verruculosa]
MGKSYDNKPKVAAQKPHNWDDQITHKYCGAVDVGRTGKSNKAQRCEQCVMIKASLAKQEHRETNSRRNEKMGWQAGDLDRM